MNRPSSSRGQDGIQAHKPELRSNYWMSWRLYFLLAGLMIVFAFSHVLAVQKIEAMQSKRPVTAIDPLAD